MSFSERLRKIALIGAIGASFLAPETRAEESPQKDKAPDRMEQKVTTGWTWGTDRASLRDKAAYESLPPEYKVYANKDFMTRLKIREEWEQRDFIKHDRRRTAILKKNPNATVGDYNSKAPLPNLKLADYPVPEGSAHFKIIQDNVNGRLSFTQARVAEEVMTMGRPLATIDPKMPYADQLEMCGFDVMAKVVRGEKFRSLSPRDVSIFIAQDQDADSLNNREEEGRRDLRIRLSREESEEWKAKYSWIDNLFRRKTERIITEETKGAIPFEKINGKSVVIRSPNEMTYSIHDEVTHIVAKKIEQEEKEIARRAKNANSRR